MVGSDATHDDFDLLVVIQAAKSTDHKSSVSSLNVLRTFSQVYGYAILKEDRACGDFGIKYFFFINYSQWCFCRHFCDENGKEVVEHSRLFMNKDVRAPLTAFLELCCLQTESLTDCGEFSTLAGFLTGSTNGP